ncbi:MAG TPA: hypothetical protein VHE56_09585 [Mycobacteriales bacterium]|nr:hypothetical protein [Mycobacteriales bacterium]
MAFVRALMPGFKRFDGANAPICAAATVPLVDLLAETVSPSIREGNEGAPYHAPATLGFVLGAFEKSMPTFTPGFTSTAWISWAFWLKTEVGAKVTRSDAESIIIRGLAQWSVDAGRYLALADVTADTLRLPLFSQLAAELHIVFGPDVATSHLAQPPPT